MVTVFLRGENIFVFRYVFVVAFISLYQCVGLTEPKLQEIEKDAAGGDTTVFDMTHNAYSQPLANLPITKRGKFFIGNSFVTKPWVTAPASTKARDGLGPLHNANSCQSCHVRDGRGKPPDAGEIPISLLVRVSLPTPRQPTSSQQEMLLKFGLIPEPSYGGQIAPKSIPGVIPEPAPLLHYTESKGKFADGKDYILRKPTINFQYANSQIALHKDVLTSARVAPVMIGMGLLEAIPETSVLATAKQQAESRSIISGRANFVWNQRLQKPTLGRFGWKAGNPTVEQQTAAALVNDMGITSSLFPQQPCTPKQVDCLAAFDDGKPEISDEILEFVVFYARTLAVPARRDTENPKVQRGEKLFAMAQCVACHLPQQRTGDYPKIPQLANQDINPYTDLLLHDMGPGLADNRPEFGANGREWRTPPLWGIGLVQTVNGHSFFLHDGRARDLIEAVLWHDGEARESRDYVLNMSANDREALIRFLQSL